jgi:Xaa-Pro aminopeptidase
VAAPFEFVDPASILHEFRWRKGPEEIEWMQRAADISAEAHVAAMQAARPGMAEYELEAVLLAAFRSHGAGRPAYECIVGTGPNATILHYRAGRRRLERGDVVLIDAGCEYEYYASDITRVFPVSGTFSGEQRALYDVVLAAQEASIRACVVGATQESVHDVSVNVLVDGLRELGLLDAGRDEILEKELYKAFYMHRTGHWLGMDVHDAGAYSHEGKPRPFEAGVVTTVEPGLYVSTSNDKVAERWRGIGIRIEDDVVVTDGAPRVLTHGVPKAAEEVERLVGTRAVA